MKKFLLTFLWLLPATAFSQTHLFTLDSDFMARGELRVGGNAASNTSAEGDFAAFILGRARLAAHYQLQLKDAAPRLEVRMAAQYSGTWGASSSALTLYEGWLKAHWGKGFFAQLGRQPLSYDDQRIFGSDDWSMTGISHDGLKLGYDGARHKVHLFGAFNQNPSNISGGTYYTGGLQPYKGLAALWYHWDLPWIPLGLSLIVTDIMMQGEKQEDNTVHHQQMAGAYLHFHPEKWSVEAAYYKQMGKEEHGIPIDAWMAGGKVKFTPTGRWAFRLGYDYLSGDTDFAVPPGGKVGMQHHSVIRGFSSLYGSRHAFYGAMDFFYLSAFYGGFTPGLQNAYAGATFKPLPALSIDLAYHFLATAAKLSNAEQPLGHELEISAEYRFKYGISLSLGYTFMRGTETMVILKRTSDKRELHWGWIMLRATPRFLEFRR